MVEEHHPPRDHVTLTEDGDSGSVHVGDAGHLTPGQVLAGRYRIRSQLGFGGMGVVWRASDLKLRVEVALKTVRGDHLKNERHAERLRQEVTSAREVISPNVCRIFDLIEVDGHELVSMEYVDGGTLLDVLRDRGPLDLKEAQDIASQFLAGLEAIHKAGLVHRDVKPENIMITRAGRVVLMDFGLARQEDSGTGSISGTPAYMAPEQTAGLKVDARADVYSAGVVLAEMVSPEGIKSFESRHSIWDGIQSEPPRLPDSPWAAVIRRAVARNRKQRPRSAHTLIRELEDVTLRVAGAEDLTPYPGLASFTESDAEYFFGREAEVEAMWARLEGPARLLGLVGPSGAGKTSFVRAGVTPVAPAGCSVIRCTPGTTPAAALRRALVPALGGDTEALADLAGGDDAAVVACCTRWRTKHERVLIVVDQFEELFTLSPQPTQESFAELLRRLPLEADVHVVLSMRDDFLMECHRHEALRAVVSDLMLLDPPTGANLRRALVQPAMRCGYRFEDDALVDEMLGEVQGERGALPLLAFAAAQLWERRDREAGLLTREAYESVGGVGGALGRHAEATIDRIGGDRVPVVRELFRNLVTAEGTRAVRDADDLLSVFGESEREAAGEVLRGLVDARLLTTYEIHDDDRDPTRRVEIIHESLLANWPRLVRWQTQDADAAQLRDQLRQAARTWEEHGRSDDLLWTGAAYREFSVWREGYAGGLSAVEQDFADAMSRHAARARRRRRIVAAAVLTVAAAVAAVTTALWRRSEQQTLRAEGARLLAIAKLEIEQDPTAALAWVTASLELADTPEARRFAVEALWRGPTRFEVEPVGDRPHPDSIEFSPDGRYLAANTNASDQLLVWSEDGTGPRLFGPTDKTRFLGDINFSTTEKGEPVLLQGVGAAIKLWSVPEFEVLREFTIDTGWTLWAPGKIVAFLEQDDAYMVQSWPYDGGEPITHGCWQPPGGASPWIDAAGESLLFIRGREVVRRPLEHLESELHDEVLARHPAEIVWPRDWGARFPQVAGDPIAVLDASGVVRIWSSDPDPLHPTAALRGPGPGFWTDDTGTMLCDRSEDDRALQIWDTAGPPDAEPLDIPSCCTHPERRWIAHQGSGTLSFWPLGGPHPRVLKGDSSSITDLTFVGDGSRLVSASKRWIRLWPLSSASGELAHELVEASPDPAGVAANPSGNTLLISRWHYTGVHRMELPTGRLEPVWPAREGIVYAALAFSPDGRQAAAAAGYAFTSPNMVMRVWDTTTWSARVFDLRDAEWSGTYDGEYLGGVNSMQFTPDGQLLTAGSGGVRLWDLETGEAEWVVRTVNERYMFMSADRSGRYLLTAETIATPRGGEDVGALALYDRTTGTSRAITTHGEDIGARFALDPTGTIVVTSAEGVLQVGSADGSEPHLLFGHRANVTAIAISPDSRWIASGDQSGEIRIWPMPDVSKLPLHTLAPEELLARLHSLTNLRVVRDDESASGWRMEVGTFPGWQKVPTW